jgi:hypothetical protein
VTMFQGRSSSILLMGWSAIRPEHATQVGLGVDVQREQVSRYAASTGLDRTVTLGTLDRHENHTSQ